MCKIPEQLMFIKNGKSIQKTCNQRMDGKISLITGATSGVGYEAAKALAQAGSNLILIARNEEKAIAVKHEIINTYSVNVDFLIADFSDLDSVKNVAKKILETYPKIDVLINSAGIHSTRNIKNKDGYEMVFCVNHLSSFLLTYLLLDKMKASAPSRIIQVNSEGHRFNGLNLKDLNWNKRIYTGLRSYGASKTAQLLTVWQFDQLLKGTGVTINAMHPGAVKTNIGHNNGKLYRFFLHHVTWKFLKNPKISGDALYYLSAADELKDKSGTFFNLTIEEKPAKHALNQKNQKLIWQQSMIMVGLDTKDVKNDDI